MKESGKTGENTETAEKKPAGESPAPAPARPVEHGGPKGAEPTRFGDWEKNGRCIDF